MAECTTITIPDLSVFKQKALAWANRFRVVCLLDSNQYALDKYSTREWILAVDALTELEGSDNAFDALEEYRNSTASEIFGFLTYDLKNQLEKLGNHHADNLGFPLLYFFKPRYLLELNGNKLTVNRNYPETFELLEQINQYVPDKASASPLSFQSRTGKTDYLNNVQAIRQQIEAGDFYEMNYCNEFYAENASIPPVDTFVTLNQKAQAPFSCFFKLNDNYLLCASPERFLQKNGNTLVSQPIKGTMRKGNTETENEQLKQQLQTDVKERAENVMIVDLVRNDLARSAKPGSVKVEELCEVYEFNTVNQMISTVMAETETSNPTDCIKNAFPMGSMTGAPKVEVMKNIEQYENFRRGLYSGSVGYFTSDGNFDFNVVIRCILYNSTTDYISVPVGGAITYDSVPEKEYEEMLLKAQNTLSVLNTGTPMAVQ
jgi:para-aminobenzoate synthetase component 1